MTRRYQNAEGTAAVHVYAGDYVIQVYTAAGTRRDFAAWRNSSAFHGRQWTLMTAPGQGSDVLRDDLPTLRSCAIEAIALVAAEERIAADRWPHADDPTRVDSLGREHDDPQGDAPAVVNGDGTPTLTTLRAFGMTVRETAEDPSTCYRHYVSLALGEACPDCLTEHGSEPTWSAPLDDYAGKDRSADYIDDERTYASATRRERLADISCRSSHDTEEDPSGRWCAKHAQPIHTPLEEHDPARNVAFGLPAEWVTREHIDGARFTASPATHDAYEREVVDYLTADRADRALHPWARERCGPGCSHLTQEAHAAERERTLAARNPA